MYKNNKKPLVLVVDDEPKVLRFIEINLKLHGFEVIFTTSGEKALELVKSAKPDIVLLDIVMPDFDGFQVLEGLRTFTDIPIIAFSASNDNQEKAIQLGANDFIPKPFYIDEMNSKINKLIRY